MINHINCTVPKRKHQTHCNFLVFFSSVMRSRAFFTFKKKTKTWQFPQQARLLHEAKHSSAKRWRWKGKIVHKISEKLRPPAPKMKLLWCWQCWLVGHLMIGHGFHWFKGQFPFTKNYFENWKIGSKWYFILRLLHSEKSHQYITEAGVLG